MVCGEVVAVHIDSSYTRDDALMFWLGQFRKVGSVIKGITNDRLFGE